MLNSVDTISDLDPLVVENSTKSVGKGENNMDEFMGPDRNTSMLHTPPADQLEENIFMPNDGLEINEDPMEILSAVGTHENNINDFMFATTTTSSPLTSENNNSKDNNAAFVNPSFLTLRVKQWIVVVPT